MITLLIIADDFTGALDTGVQFAAAGAVVRVVTDIRYEYRQADEEVQVLVMDAETRHLNSSKAYDVIWDITRRAMQYKIPHIYKKTDSALRGNIGSELTALLEASERKVLPFLPAFPQMKRTTKEGIHYIEGVPVKDSVFGKDPFEPVTCSYIPDIIGLQSNIKVEIAIGSSVKNDDNRKGERQAEKYVSLRKEEEDRRIVVYDAESDEQLAETAKELAGTNQLNIMAGCAGFASALPELLNLGGHQSHIPEFIPYFLVLCGSLNPITRRQLDYGERHGFTRIRLTVRQKLDREYWSTPEGIKVLKGWMHQLQTDTRCILDSNDPEGSDETMEYARERHIDLEEVRKRIADSLGYILKTMLKNGLQSTILITGGDTLLGFMNQIGVCEMEPVCEKAPGTVLSYFKLGDDRCQAISKSGGFGSEELLVNLAEDILNKEND